MLNLTRWWPLAAVLCLAGCGGGEGGSAPPSAEASGGGEPLIVGMELAYPPFEMTATDGEPAGLSVDLARALAEDLGRPLEIENIQFAGLIPALQSGRIDLIISSMTATEERAKSVAFSEPYAKIGLAMLVPEDSLIDGVEDLDAAGEKVAVKRGTTSQVYAAEHLKDARMMVFDRADAAVTEVVQNRADAFIYDQLSIYRYARRHPDTTRPVLTAIEEEAWAIALRQSDTELLGQVNAFLTKFKEDGGFERLGDRYLQPAKEAFQAHGIPFIF
ncbi:MAG: transporter substrate-binding domain-containing protein [Verrucomicrobiota bacterium]